MSGSVFLVGPMGAGKSTIGKRLAQLLNWPFIDSDSELEQRAGATIPWIFEREGEASFRAREKQVIDELTQRSHIVLATGGGAILDPDNRQCLHTRGLAVYLRTSVHEQLRRTRGDRNRPLLQTADPRARLEQLYQVRHPLYEQTAHLVIDTDSQQVRQVAQQIVLHLQDATKL